MRIASAGFKTELGQEALNLARIWTLTPRKPDFDFELTLPDIGIINDPDDIPDGYLPPVGVEIPPFMRRLRFTDLSSDVFYGGRRFDANPGISISAIRNSVEGGFQTATITVPLSDEGIDELAVRAGDFDNATFSLDLLHYLKPELGVMSLFSGRVVKATTDSLGNGTFDVQQDTSGTSTGVLNEVYSERCRNIFGDRRCKVDLEPLSVQFTVTDVPAVARFTAAEVTQKEAGYWDIGTVAWLTGGNAGRLFSVVKTDGENVLLERVPGRPIQPGDIGTLRPGCTKYRTMCKDRWNNLPNLRGEPDVPSIHAAPPPPEPPPPPPKEETNLNGPGGTNFFTYAPPGSYGGGQGGASIA